MDLSHRAHTYKKFTDIKASYPAHAAGPSTHEWNNKDTAASYKIH